MASLLPSPRLFQQLTTIRYGSIASFSSTSKACADDPHKPALDFLGNMMRQSRASDSRQSQPRQQGPPQNRERGPRIGRPRPQQGNADSARHAAELLSTMQNQNRNQPAAVVSETAAQAVKNDWLGKQLNNQLSRRWHVGDVYAPHDLSPVEMKKWKKKGTPAIDAFDALDMNPIDEYKNFTIMQDYMSAMGRIKHSKETGLRNVNQRKIAKAIRRVIGMGLMPSTHRHPEFLMREATRRTEAAKSPLRGPQL